MTSPPPKPKTARFVGNVLWSWLAVVANLFLGLVLSPLMIRMLGETRYGVWALVYSVIDYLLLFDLGFRSAIVNRVAHYFALKDQRSLNESISAAAAFLSVVSLLVASATILLHPAAANFFRVDEAYRGEFTTLLLITGLWIASSLILMIGQAALEGLQLFGPVNRNYVIALLLRSIISVIVLYSGGGLVALGTATVLSQTLGSLLNLWSLRRALPELEVGRQWIRMDRGKEMLHFGMRTTGIGIAQSVVNQAPAILIGRALPEAYVGFYLLPQRLLNYAVDGITRIGFITAPNTAEQIALGRRQEVLTFAISLNRFCFALFLPFALFVLLYGPSLIRVWAGEKFAEASVPLLPAFIAAAALGTAGQFNSSSVLFGIGRHGSYAKVLAAEAALLLVSFPIALSKLGLVGAAWVASILLISFRGMATAWILTTALEYSFWRFLAGVYFRPSLTIVPLVALLLTLKNTLLPGNSWYELLPALAVAGTVQLVFILFLCIDRPQRQKLASHLGRWVPQLKSQ